MKLLIDTNALSWFALDRTELSRKAKAALESEAAVIHVSAITPFEMSTKLRIGKWPQIAPLVQNFEAYMEEAGFRLLSLSNRHALVAGAFPQDHRDPFDRLLAAQALLEGLPIVSSDPEFESFGVQRIW